jgi:membrane protease YdiL (CAAX protease family)
MPDVPRAYHDFYRAPAFRWWKVLVLLAAMVAGFAVVEFTVVIVLFAGGWVQFEDGQIVTNFPLFLGNNIGLALMIPVAFLLHWLIFRQRPGWLISITGRFRWGFFARCAGIVLVFELGTFAYEFASGGLGELVWQPDGAILAVAIVLTTPFQAAAEEIFNRGILFRGFGSLFKWRIPGLIAAAVFTSAVFMALHAAEDMWLNIYYFGFGLISCFLIWQTGGLEAGIAFHIVHNLASESIIPWTGVDGMFDRGAGTGDPILLVYLGLHLIVAALIVWQAKRMKLPVLAR